MVERTVVGIDGSGPSAAALKWALAHTAASRTTLVLVHAVDHEGSSAEAERQLMEALDECLAAGREARMTIEHGGPARALTREAKPRDVLVIGSHKTGYLRGRVSGTRSVLIASLARCRTVVVPEDNSAQRRGVVVGVPDGAESRAAVIIGAVEAQRLDQQLTLILAAPDARTEAGRTLLADAAELAALTAPAVTVRRRVSHRRPSDALLDASRSAALLVLGATRADADGAGIPGSVLHEVLLNLNSPVMVAR